MVYSDSVMYSVWIADTLEAYKRFKARERIKDITISILSIQVAKARQSAQKFAKSGKVEDCRDALYDCQGENETKGYAIAIQNRMLSAADSLNRRHVSEILRQMSVKDSLSTGWGQANQRYIKEKSKRWGLGVHAGYGAGKQGLSPFVGIGISYTPIRF
jgi:opacity protein-like surface antigen